MTAIPDPIKMVYRDGVLTVENFYYTLDSGKMVLGRQNIFSGINYVGSIVELSGKFRAFYHSSENNKMVYETFDSYVEALAIMLEVKLYLKVFPTVHNL